LKVLLLTNMYPTAEEPQFGCFVEEQVDDLRAAGVGVDVVVFDARTAAFEYARAARSLRWHLTREGPYDLVHAHYGLTGAVAATQRLLPVVTTFHGSETGYVRWQALVSWIVARLTEPIFVSRRAARALGRLDANVVPMGVDTARFRPIPRTVARGALGWDGAASYVLFPGSRVNRRKNAPLFDAAVDAVRRRGTDLRAVSLEGLTRDEVSLVMNGVDVTLMTSHFEGSPVAVRESLACLTPVVSVLVGDVEEVINVLPGCTVCAREPEALASAVLAALGLRREDAHRLRERAQRSARPVVARRLLDVYGAVLEQRRRHR
jgi:teichuronic acid biosynthesis glycosyltransferase TuaC